LFQNFSDDLANALQSFDVFFSGLKALLQALDIHPESFELRLPFSGFEKLIFVRFEGLLPLWVTSTVHLE
jgi:hypothetical protein